MNSETNEKPVWHIGIIFIVACLFFAALVAIVKFSTTVPKIDADRAVVISKALYEIHTNEVASLNNAGWIDRTRGIVRLPISVAMKMAASEWQNPAAARANLISRVEKANAPLPKAAPKPNPFD